MCSTDSTMPARGGERERHLSPDSSGCRESCDDRRCDDRPRALIITALWNTRTHLRWRERCRRCPEGVGRVLSARMKRCVAVVGHRRAPAISPGGVFWPRVQGRRRGAPRALCLQHCRFVRRCPRTSPDTSRTPVRCLGRTVPRRRCATHACVDRAVQVYTLSDGVRAPKVSMKRDFFGAFHV